MDVFDIFSTVSYDFLEISRGNVYGNQIVSRVTAEGIFKLRSGITRTTREEYRQSTATLHIKPTESFLTTFNKQLVGHGIEIGFDYYEIVGITEGIDFVTGKVNHYTLTLQSADFAEVS